MASKNERTRLVIGEGVCSGSIEEFVSWSVCLTHGTRDV